MLSIKEQAKMVALNVLFCTVFGYFIGACGATAGALVMGTLGLFGSLAVLFALRVVIPSDPINPLPSEPQEPGTGAREV